MLECGANEVTENVLLVRQERSWLPVVHCYFAAADGEEQFIDFKYTGLLACVSEMSLHIEETERFRLPSLDFANLLDNAFGSIDTGRDLCDCAEYALPLGDYILHFDEVPSITAIVCMNLFQHRFSPLSVPLQAERIENYLQKRGSGKGCQRT